MEKVAVVVGVVSAFLLYNVNSFLFWSAILCTIAFLISFIAVSYIQAKPAMKKYENKIKEMTEQGATVEELESVESFPVEDVDREAAPNWLVLLNLLTFIFIIILFIIGMILGFK